MKKLSYLFVFAAFCLFSTTTFAQEVEKVKEVKEIKTAKKMQDKVQVELSELPEAVTTTLGEQFADFTPAKAYKKSHEGKVAYYVKLKKEDKYIKVLIDAEGKVLEQNGAEIK